MVKGCLFDMDGVLLDTEQMGLELLPQVAARHGYAFSQELYMRALGTNHELGKRILLEALGRDFPYDQVMDEFFAAFLEAAKAGILPVKAGLSSCLKGLKALGIKLALVTSTARDVVEVYLAHVPDMQGMFDAVVCGSEVEKSKPEPDIYLLAAQKLGLAPEECIGVEDSRNGLLSLAAAGIPSVMIPDLLPYDDSFANIVTWKLDNLDALCPLVDSLNN